jgi:hypothetical protein
LGERKKIFSFKNCPSPEILKFVHGKENKKAGSGKFYARFIFL